MKHTDSDYYEGISEFPSILTRAVSIDIKSLVCWMISETFCSPSNVSFLFWASYR